jgi:hypothetical protein
MIHTCDDDNNNGDADTTLSESTLPKTPPSKWNDATNNNTLLNLSPLPATPTDKPYHQPTSTCNNDDIDNDTNTTLSKWTLHKTLPFEWTDDINSDTSFYSNPSPAPPADKPHHQQTNITQCKTTPASSAPQGNVISRIVTQNAQGLCRCPCNPDGKLCPNDPYDYTRYKHLITTMKLKQLDIYFIQET